MNKKLFSVTVCKITVKTQSIIKRDTCKRKLLLETNFNALLVDWISYTLVIIISLGFFYRNILTETWRQAYNRYFPCQSPISYSIGNFDTKFGISKEDFLSAIVSAESIWEKSLYLSICRHNTPYRSEIRRNISMALGLSSVTKYRAITAKKICSEFGAGSVLDPCVGWGGRMLGTICLGIPYVGCEPDHNTFNKLQKVLNHDSIPFFNQSLARIIPKPFEIGVNDINETFDMILTSPPYFNLEIYTSGEQSIDSFSSWESWKDWLKNTIISCVGKLNTNGTSCWSVKNIKTDKKYPISDITINIHKEIGWELVKIISLKGSSRDGKNVDTKESTYCFKKSTDLCAI
jgi:hypothetical protein